MSEKYGLVAAVKSYSATDPRDKIFAVQGLVKNIYPPDYSKSVSQIYTEYAMAWIENLGVRDIFRLAGRVHGFNNQFNLPSWAPDWQELSRTNWMYDSALKGFDASHGLNCLASSQMRFTSYFTLEAPGVQCDSIEVVYPQQNMNCSDIYTTCKNFAT